ncbi:hypothetical protein [Ferrimonas marina]|uniref:Pectate lyase n=1 Tax=Ferrimonas marina TaxID=299255 RepID=A0A1M5VZF9_9GAMM|nr:hypothetical protein [Ferrimonas marina]SHH80570.1 hypothetical protein SAMN02745129_3077 [Ferrimonas marina]
MNLKQLMALVLALWLTSGLSACSDNSSSEEPEQPPPVNPDPDPDPDPPVDPDPDPDPPVDPDPDPDPPVDPDPDPDPPVDPDPDPPEQDDRYVCEPMSPLPVIPCQIGFGMDTPAGSGRHEAAPDPDVYKVVNLNNGGEGSLRRCVDGSGPRVCVFEVAGYIDLTDRLNISNDYITIAGQTAPSPGITLRGHTVRIEADHVLMQHIRIRPGDDPDNPDPGNRDGLLVIGSYTDTERQPSSVILDHLSVSWGIDENFTTKEAVYGVTISNSIIAEGLNYSLHPKGKHSKGLMMESHDMLVYRNLLAHLDDRGPLDVAPTSIVANNLVYNTAQVGHRMWGLKERSYHDDEVRIATVVNNVRIPGANTQIDDEEGHDNQWVMLQTTREGSKVYIEGNQCGDFKNDAWPCVVVRSDGADQYRVKERPIWLDGLELLPASEVEDAVLAFAGARPADRDSADARVVEEVRSRTGTLKNCVGPDNIMFPRAKVTAASSNTVTGKVKDCNTSKEGNKGRRVHIYEGPGAGQWREITEKNQCSGGELTLTVDRDWGTTPTTDSSFEVEVDCSLNGGGWPVLESTERPLSLPENYNELMPSGYTRLEEWLHSFYAEVE